MRRSISSLKTPNALIFLLTANILALVSQTLIRVTGIGVAVKPLIDGVVLILPLPFVALHAAYALGVKRGIGFLCLAALSGLFFEIIGVRYGMFFGGRYVYRVNPPMILDVPLVIAAFWMVFIYVGYNFVNSFFIFSHFTKQKLAKNIHFFPWLVVMDGLVVVGGDMLMDPLMVHDGWWTWIDKGAYFGVPIGNFLGWFCVVVVATGVFRAFEYFSPQRSQSAERFLYILPVFYSTALFMSFFLIAVSLNWSSLALIGLSVTIPLLYLNLLFFHFRNNL